MEKFTNWRDKGTGIAPFLPAASDKENVFFNSAIAVNTVLLVVLVAKCVVCVPLVLLGQVLPKLNILALRVMLYGRIKMDYQVHGVKRSAVSRNTAQFYLQPDTLYIANYSSALVAVVLPLISAKPLRFIVPDANQFYAMSPLELIAFTMAGQSLDPQKHGHKLDRLDLASSPHDNDNVWVLLAEGTCSNGKSVLPFQTGRAAVRALLGEEEGSPSTSATVSASATALSLRVNASLVTPLGGSPWRLLLRLMLAHKCVARVRSGERRAVASEDAALDGFRTALNDGDKYKLVSKTLGTAQKRAFVREYRKVR